MPSFSLEEAQQAPAGKSFSLDDALTPDIKLDPYQQSQMTGANRLMDSGKDDFLRAVASDVVPAVRAASRDLGERLDAASRDIGQRLDAGGKLISGIVKTGADLVAGGRDQALQEIAATADTINPPQVTEATPSPWAEGKAALPVIPRAAAAGAEGLLQTAPQMMAASINPYLGALTFGFTPEGFDPKQAALAVALPVVGKYTGAIAENIAARAGVSSDVALAGLNKLGGAAGAAGLIGADQARTILALPKDQQADAWVDAAGNVGSMFLLGTLGETKRLDDTTHRVVVGELHKALARDPRWATLDQPGQPIVQMSARPTGPKTFGIEEAMAAAPADESAIRNPQSAIEAPSEPAVIPASDSGRPQGPSPSAPATAPAEPVASALPVPETTPAPIKAAPPSEVELTTAASPSGAGETIDNPPPKAQSKSAGAETITGQNAREGADVGAIKVASQMPAEPGAGANPIPDPNQPSSKISKAVQRNLDRPFDLIDHAETNIGKIDPTLIREADPNWKPVGAARKLFKVGGTPADVAADSLNRLGHFKGDPGQPDKLGAALNAAALGRKGDRSTASRENKIIRVEAKQAEQFGKRVLAGERPKAEQSNVETVPVHELVEGDSFKVQNHNFKVERMEFDEDGNITNVTLKDGPKFGTQQLDGTEVIHFDKGTLQTSGKAVEFLPPEPAPAVPKLREGERGTGSLLQGDEPFNLAGEKGVDVERIAREKAAKEASAKANAEFQAKNTKDLFAGDKNQVAGFGGSGARGSRGATPRPARVTTPPPVAATPAPTVHPVANFLHQNTLGLRSVTAPQTIGMDGRNAANALRHFMGMNANAMARADEGLHTFRKEFDRTPVAKDWAFDPAQPLPHNYAIIDALERDPSQLPPRYQELAKTFAAEFAWRIAEIQKYAPHALQHLIQNYFPHIWTEPKRAGDAMAQVATRLFAGRKEFLKERSLPFFREGLERGLVPISDNPVDLLMAKMHSMDKFLLALRATKEFKASGAMKFKYIFEKLPDGYQVIDDPSFIVQKPPVVTIKEAFDQFQRAKLGEILKDIGVSYTRVASLGGTRWAEADRGFKAIRAGVGASEDILWHELGHHLDWHFPTLRSSLPVRGNGTIATQMRAIADLRTGGNPVPASHQKYLRKTEEKMAEIFRGYVHAPDLMKRTAPDVMRIVDKFLDTQPRLRDQLREMRGGGMEFGHETTDVKLPGMQVLGHWIMPDGPAKVVQNYLSPGLSRFAAYRTFKSASNILNVAQLGLSAFHLGFTSLDAATSRLAIGIEDAYRGDFARAAKTVASVPFSPVTNILQGRRILEETLHPGSTDAETAALVKALEAAGGRIGQDRFYQTDFLRRMKRAFHEGTATGYLKGTVQAPFALIETMLKPIMEYVVPRQKLGVFADMARRELERLGPNATVDQTREAMRKAWDSVDNRMGQVVYDNLFMNRMAKDLALTSFRAYGWQLGKYREGFGALADTAVGARDLANFKKPEMSHRMAYAMALPIMVGIIGGTMNYLMTGQRPQDWQDYFMPRTGATDNNGNPARVHLPSYLKDVIAYAKHPLTSLGHSLNPMLGAIADLLGNKDFYDVRIRNPDDPLWQQASDVAQFAAKQFVPFSVSGTMKLREEDSPAWQQVAPFFGVTPVPARITMSPAQELAADITAAAMPKEPRTKEQFDRSKLVKDIVRQIKQGDRQTAVAELKGGLEHGILNESAATTILDRLQYTPMQFQVHHMSADAAMRIWRLARPDEKTQLQAIVSSKIENSQTLTDEVKDEYGVELGAPKGWWLNSRN